MKTEVDRERDFRAMCRAEPDAPELALAITWMDCRPAEQIEMVYCFLEAAEAGRLGMVPYPELDYAFKEDHKPWVSRGLLTLIEDAIKANPWASRDGYATDLAGMSRTCRGPESPAGWVPFCCGIGRKQRPLLTGLWPVNNTPAGLCGPVRVALLTMAEMLQFRGVEYTGPRD